MSSATIEVIEASNYRLKGDITHTSVPFLWQQVMSLPFAVEQLEVSLQHTTRFDSAGLVMLIHLLEHAKNRKCHIMLSFIPKQLEILIELYNLDSVIEKHI
ncbi:STAS domain-containing protein [Vibrio hippocampi]|uniref:STAS domain-containing protein n=1 Tax=Vibrio hippocampi TaxID=654686 RepID=A0ABN8DHJ8_9VIBR|nr:STAS domain-containing protein [Vibrio hippocampi]CAH0527178.1 hypothetical protein VHP8226_02520 [Vibrio hippocampi]